MKSLFLISLFLIGLLTACEENTSQESLLTIYDIEQELGFEINTSEVEIVKRYGSLQNYRAIVLHTRQIKGNKMTWGSLANRLHLKEAELKSFASSMNIPNAYRL